jgi:PilZ domain
MKLKEHVRGTLLLSKELLTRSEFQGNPGEDEGIAHDIFVSDDAAEMAMGAICSQLGSPEQTRRASVSDYFAWLQRVGNPGAPIAGLEYFSALHKTRMDLQNRFIIPEVHKWRGVRETTLGFIARWCQDYLHVQVWNLQWQLAGAVQETIAPPESAVPDFSSEITALKPEAHEEERRYSPRYECEGSAEIRVPTQGRLVRGRIVNLSLGGCYIETNGALDAGSKVEIVLRVTGLAFRAAGEIKSVYGSAGVGIQFTGMSSGGRTRLKELIGELEEAWFSAGMPSEGGDD